MPYIKQEDRAELNTITEHAAAMPHNAGELQYVIAILINSYINELNHTPKYQDYNDIIGALEGAKLEFYRRVVAPYEDTKIKENGDVY